MNPHVKSVRALENYELEVLFENGDRRIFDVKPYLSRGIFVRLQDHGLFQAVRAVAGSVEWPGGLDLSYETLYIEGRPISEARRNAHETLLRERLAFNGNEESVRRELIAIRFRSENRTLTMDLTSIFFHDSEIIRVIEEAQSGDLFMEIEYPTDW